MATHGFKASSVLEPKLLQNHYPTILWLSRYRFSAQNLYISVMCQVKFKKSFLVVCHTLDDMCFTIEIFRKVDNGYKKKKGNLKTENLIRLPKKEEGPPFFGSLLFSFAMTFLNDVHCKLKIC